MLDISATSVPDVCRTCAAYARHSRCIWIGPPTAPASSQRWARSDGGGSLSWDHNMVLNGVVVRIGALLHQVEPLPPYRPDKPSAIDPGPTSPQGVCVHICGTVVGW
jgi:hypothetical protein